MMRLPHIENGQPSIISENLNAYMAHYFGHSLDEILTPIGDSQVGESVRHNGVYFKIKEARREDDASLPQGVWTHEMKLADWDQVERTAIEALCHKSKDLQLGVWLMESSINRYGFSGIAPAALLIRALCEEFWNTMHPQMIDDDIEFRTNPINWINEKLSLRLRLLPITSTPLDGREFTWDDWENAQRFDQLKRQNQENIQWEGVTTEAYKQRLSATPKEFLWHLCEQIDDAIRAIDLLIDWFDETCGNDSPSLGEMKLLLDNIHTLSTSELSRRGVTLSFNGSDDDAIDGMNNDDQGGNGTQGGGGSDGEGSGQGKTDRMRNREDAFAQLKQAAEFLMRDDPHSPVPYMVYAACNWGEKDAPDLYEELFLQKGGQLNIFEMMGLDIQTNNT